MDAFALDPHAIVTRREGAVAIVQVNRAAKKNAMTLAMWKEVARIYADLARDSAVRAIVFTGGGGIFGAGADIGEFQVVRTNAADAAAYDLEVDRCVAAITNAPQPTVAAISGVCAAGSIVLALACDFRVADRSAVFFLPPARLGIVYGVANCRRLANVVGLPNAKRILYSGRRFGVDEANANGFVDETTDVDPVAAAIGFVREMTECAPLSVAGMKTVLEAIGTDEVEARREEIERAIHVANASEDQREAVRAFAEKRKPVFTGR